MFFSRLKGDVCKVFGNYFSKKIGETHGIIESETTCSKCKIFISYTNDFITLRCLPFSNIQASIAFFFAKQLIEANDFYCQHCQSVHTSCMQLFLKHAPKFLILDFYSDRTFQGSEIDIEKLNIQNIIYVNERPQIN